MQTKSAPPPGTFLLFLLFVSPALFFSCARARALSLSLSHAHHYHHHQQQQQRWHQQEQRQQQQHRSTSSTEISTPPTPSFLESAEFLRVVVSKSAPLAGTTVRDAGFRERFDAVIVAYKRAARAPLRCRFGDVELSPGDALVLAAPPAFVGADAPEFRENFDLARPLAGGGGGLGNVGGLGRREFTTSLVIPRGSSLAGKTVEEAGLRGIDWLLLFAVERLSPAGAAGAGAGAAAPSWPPPPPPSPPPAPPGAVNTFTAFDGSFALRELDTLWFALMTALFE